MILVKTEMGHQVLRDRSVRMTPRQRSAFILFDGKRTVAEVLQASQSEQDDIDALVSLGLLGRPAKPVQPEPDSVRAELSESDPQIKPKTSTPKKDRTSQERYRVAYPIATQLTASLGLRGFRLNLAVEAATTCEELTGLIPKIRSALGPEKVAPLERALVR